MRISQFANPGYLSKQRFLATRSMSFILAITGLNFDVLESTNLRRLDFVKKLLVVNRVFRRYSPLGTMPSNCSTGPIPKS